MAMASKPTPPTGQLIAAQQIEPGRSILSKRKIQQESDDEQEAKASTSTTTSSHFQQPPPRKKARILKKVGTTCHFWLKTYGEDGYNLAELAKTTEFGTLLNSLFCKPCRGKKEQCLYRTRTSFEWLLVRKSFVGMSFSSSVQDFYTISF